MTTALDTLRLQFEGDVVEPGDAEYESAAHSVLAAGHPACVLRPATTADVQAAVGFAAGTGLALSVRGGGHSFPGFGTNDGGVVIDLSGLASVQVVDKDRHIVRIGGGATWGRCSSFDFAAHPTTDVFFGRLAFPAGAATTVLPGWATTSVARRAS